MTHPFPSDAAEKRWISLRFFLQGAGYHRALRAFDYNRRLFTGKRKDGLTPEFDHHVCQALYLRTLIPHLLYPEETFCTIAFHDTMEDRDVSQQEIIDLFTDDSFNRLYSRAESAEFAGRVAHSTHNMTKVFRGVKVDEVELFQKMAKDPISSLNKGIDRFHNQQTMIRTFTVKKMGEYVEETKALILPMMKEAELMFPSQEPAYKNVRTALKSQVDMVERILELSEGR